MSFSYGFFNAQNLDRVYTAEDFTAYLSSLICNGILDTYRQCFAPAIKNLSVTFGTGKAWIDGHYFISDTLHTIDLSSYVDESLNRYVAIGIYCDRSTRTCGIRILAGTAATSPTIPTFTNNNVTTYLTLAVVRLRAGTTSILDSDLTDCRADESKCGYCKCILGKCRVTEMLSKMAENQASLEELQKRLDAMNSQISELQTKVDDLIGGDILKSGQCGENVYYILYANGKLLLRGTGATYAYEIGTSPFFENTDIKQLVVGQGITEIGNSIFERCSNLSTASFPNTLKRIGKRAFFQFSDGGLTALQIPSSVDTIDEKAFTNQSMTTVTLPKTLTTLGTYLFQDSPLLQTVRVECAEIPAFCFVNCHKLQQLTLSQNVRKIGSHMINYCYKLDTITYEGSLAEWAKVEKSLNWDGNSGSTNPGYLNKVVCVDGEMVYDRENQTWNEVKNG